MRDFRDIDQTTIPQRSRTMSLRINTNVPPIFSRINLSIADGGPPSSAGRTLCLTPTSPFRCKQTPRGSRKAHTFATLTNTELHQTSPTWQLSNHNVGGSPRGRSISLFSPRSAAANNPNCQLDSLLPYNAAAPHSPRGNLSGRRPHNGFSDLTFSSMSPAIPVSSLSHSALDMLLKAEATLESSASLPDPTNTNDIQGAMSTLEVPNSSLSRRSSRSSARNQRMRASEPKWEKSRFTCASPCPSIGSNASPSSSSSSSACSVTSTCSINSTGSSASYSTTSSLTPSPTDRLRRSPPPDSCPAMVVQSTSASHSLSVTLPRVIQPEMVTVAAKKGDRLDVVADAWHMERDCHYEWQIRFAAGDVDMSTVRARFGQDGKLTIEVQRRLPGQGCTPKFGMGFRYRYY